MNFHVGDSVMHWTYGLGQVVQLEKRDLSGQPVLYYAVQVRDLTIWVPAGDGLDSRLRPPSTRDEFTRSLDLLGSPSDPLPDDRQERKALLRDVLKDGRAESLCRVIRDLSAYSRLHSLNDNDQALMKQARESLLGEWTVALSVTPANADIELRRLLTPHAPES
jgi:RNA polymerase-interacting CarD/CdnL/TRCF family regulator